MGCPGILCWWKVVRSGVHVLIYLQVYSWVYP